MSPLLLRLTLTALGFCLSLTAGAEPPEALQLGSEQRVRRESNVSIRNEVQLAIDKGLAHLQSTQRADGTWGKLGTTGFVLMALQRDPRGRAEVDRVGRGIRGHDHKRLRGVAACVR